MHETFNLFLEMQSRSKQILFAAVNVLFLLLIYLNLTSNFVPFSVDNIAFVLFGVLTIFAMFHGIRLAGGMASLLPMVAVAAYLVMGARAAAWLFFAAVWIHGLISLVYSGRYGPDKMTNKLDLLVRTAVNATMIPAGILFGSLLYEWLAGSISLSGSGYPVSIFLWGVGYFFINYLFVIFYFALRGKTYLRHFWQMMPRSLLYEAVPIPFAPLVARIYTDLGWDYFLFLMLAIMFLTFIIRRSNEVGLHLNRRIMELDSLKNVGQTLSAGLEIESILAAIHTQVARLMPVHTFYIALYDAAKNEVSYPFVVEGNKRTEIASRRDGNGLVEYVLREQRPLLILKDVVDTAVHLNLTLSGQEPACWLGVPIMLADDPIGVIAVQSYDQSSLYDDWHKDVLVTIAAQAAMAIENARLYAQTGSELVWRVQELNSVLSTIHEGILLVGLDGIIITANRVFSVFVGLTNEEIIGQSLFDDNGKPSLLSRIGYDREAWEHECAALGQDEKWLATQIVLAGPIERHVERTLVPVRDEADSITGWLLTFRDVTEEVELAKAREETMHMLIHDLRSPLSVTLGSLQTIDAWLEMGRTDDVRRLLDLAHTGGQRMLHLLNNLLDSYKFEDGSMPLNIEPMPVLPWLTDIKAQFSPAASNAGLTIVVEVEPDLPMLSVDKEHMVRVLANLVDNAIKFTPDGGQIKLWARRASGEDNPILIGVSDTGIGIPLSDQQRLFMKFQQNSATRGRRQGTGLGLTYCKLVVEAHNGRIWVESEGIEGQGSTFLMILPAYDDGRSPANDLPRDQMLAHQSS